DFFRERDPGRLGDAQEMRQAFSARRNFGNQFCGFVGLVVPHLTRLLIGSSHQLLLPCSALIGASLMILADLSSRMIITPAELPVSLVTSAIGAPFFLWLIARARPQ
ncbi:MAG: iron chelate uptake ABC transporter family permease subunit, partial [Pseudomonadota bacterium]